MKFRKLIYIALFLSLPITLLSSNVLFAKNKLSSEQKGNLSQNCTSIKQSLKSLQRTDSRTRVLLGTSYYTILNNYLTPLNLRLIKNNQPNSDLADNQSEIADARDQFAKRFIKYSRSLEDLIAIDCQDQPEEFYQKLQTTKKRRAKVADSVAELDQLINEHLDTVISIQKSFQEDE